MIYWFTGQPGSGKTTLATRLSEHINSKTGFRPFMVDEDDIEHIQGGELNFIRGRVENGFIAQKIAHYLYTRGCNVIVSVNLPYLSRRENFKTLLGDNIKEIYLHTNEIRGKEDQFSQEFKPPTSNFVEIDTSYDTPYESLQKILEEIDDTIV